MLRKILSGLIVIGLMLSGVAPVASAAETVPDAAVIDLPPAEMENGKPLMQTLKERHSTRQFQPTSLPLQLLSNLLWAANGVNRTEIGGRTAPSAMNCQEIDVYVAKADGVFLYNAALNSLARVLAGDVRAAAGKQDFVATAPVVLIYVVDYAKMQSMPNPADKRFYAATDTGFISQNVYLYCASAGLATVVVGWTDRLTLAQALQLRKDQAVILVQPVGYSGEK